MPLSVRVLGVTPLETPAPRLVAALGRAGALAILDLGRTTAAATAALSAVEREPGFRGSYGVRFPDGADEVVASAALPARAQVVLVSAGGDVAARVARFAGRTVVVEATSLDEARAAVAAGARGVIAKGSESGGRIGEETAFVLVQHIAAAGLGVPVFAQGGIGVHTAAAAVAGGAQGVVLSDQLAMLSEAGVPQNLRQIIGAMDGSETAVVDGRRMLSRPGIAPVALGQEAAFARPLAERFRTIPNLVKGFEQGLASHLRQAQALEPLAPSARWAAQHGIAYPIAQGPMTRVSDKASFAAAVADAGGLPFVALSLLRGPEARQLLEETAIACAGKTWGVGVLGFAPPELREEQIAAIRDVRPPVALIAGGRPAQARPLEELGIPSYLHVPSPGLLDLFLREGARRFVLEGRECGGHVGPRSSFALWDAAIERLARDPVAGEVSLLFAGGIHDARSAAMVATAAAPLAARGARIGVLMGTAYLFTEEAVASGAIQPGFQDEAIKCEATVLLETAPGHATRAAETGFVHAFRAERARLEAAGTDPREMWEQLEQLNLGRLRIAAKGLVRDQRGLVTVDDAEQRAEGMYMIGQVAALRDRVVTMADLHTDVTAGSVRYLEATPVPADTSLEPVGPRIAIVGMAGVFPGSPDLDSYWANIVLGKNAVTEVPRDRWNVDAYYDPNGTGEKTPSKWGGFLPKIPFDPAVYGIPPRSLAAIEPVQLLALEVARRALLDAGYTDKGDGNETQRAFDREKASVIFGAESGTDLSNAYGFRAQHAQFLGDMPGELDDKLPRLTEDSFPGILANVIAGRIANRLDLGGVNFTVDAACASSLAAVDLACKELSAGETDMVLCGGADLHNSIVDYLMFASVHALSATGQCKTFDSAADGIALGEGIACVVLKRLDDARRDGDRVYAVIDGVGGSSDGKSLGLTAPRKEGQMRALERAYRRAGVSPADVELVEAHGTGTVVGDRTEMETLTEVFGGAGARPGQVTLGSVKSNIGHTKCAAGLAGLMKAALSIHHRVLPPTLHMAKPNPFYDNETSPFVFRDRAQPWASSRRRAGISAFGFGGTNFHAVLSDAGEDPSVSAQAGFAAWPTELFLIRGAKADADALLGKLAALAGSGKPYRLRDLARAASGRSDLAAGTVQVSFVASSLAELADKAARARTAVSTGAASTGVFVRTAGPEAADKLAILFPGQGSQRPGMLDDLFVAFPRIQEALTAGKRWLKTLYPGAAFTPAAKTAQRAAITDTRVAQPTLGMVDLGVARLLDGVGVKADLFAGHSYGELVALCAAGAFDAGALLPMSAARAEHILAAAKGAPGTMAAVKAGADAVAAAIAGIGGVVLANRNAPDQTVIAGPDAAIDAAVAQLEAKGFTAKRIPVAAAFHSPVVAAAADTFAGVLADVPMSAPQVPVFANTTAAPYPADGDAVRAQLARQLAEPVRFADQIEAMYAAGARVFVEAGPGQVLSDLVRRILGDRPHTAIAVDTGGGSSLTSFLEALARLAALGVAIDDEPLYAGRGAVAIDLDQPPRVEPAPTAWLVDGQRAVPVKGELPDFAMIPVLEPIKVAPVVVTQMVHGGVPMAGHPTQPAMYPAGTAGAVAAADPRQAAVLEYLRGMREMVETQRQVMLSFLGTEVRAAAPITVYDVASVAAPAPVVMQSVQAAAVQVVQAATTMAHGQSAPAPALAESPLAALVAIVADRTGYPPDMLDPDLDLEADLGIDSIKRIEILGALGERLGLGGAAGDGRGELVEQLSRVKTLRAIAAWLDEKLGPVAVVAQTATTTTTTSTTTTTTVALAPVVVESPLVVLTGIVSERTGYPPDMLDPDLDLEADLGIDSIKRIEILGALAEKLGIAAAGGGDGRGELVEQLSRVKTLRGIATWLDDRLGTATPAAPAAAPAPQLAAARPSVRRFVVRAEALPPAVPNGFKLDGRRFIITRDDKGVAGALALLLVGRQAKVEVVDHAPAAPGAVDAVIHLAPLSAAGTADHRKDLFELSRVAVDGGASWLVAATSQAGKHGARPEHGGIAGMLKSVAKEHPALHVRAVDLDPDLSVEAQAGLLFAEILADERVVQVAYQGQERRTFKAVADEPTADALPPLAKGDVVLVTGGARGITARIALAMAERYGAAVELVGRSKRPEPEAPAIAAATDATALRRVLATTLPAGQRTPARIESEVRAILAGRELGATFAALDKAGVPWRYHAADVRDADALAAIVDDIYARHGRIDGVVHGAGVIEDRLLRDKTRESFDRVFDTKVVGARALLGRLRPDTRWVVFFSSVSGVFGNRGQVDYSAANEALDHLAWSRLAGGGPRVLSVNWGPWAETGMISPELEREYARKGVGLIAPGEGIDRLLAELGSAHGDAQVIFMSATPESLEA
jgi:acyl transferase domain-containing protein/NAD(P)H-dependent flavin oxidoreductase YrpB (nitropropane dioxygenase family)/NAD(P)-dependent dehydrogenase (short-subunit alcohol dehydrogenase family)